MSFILFMRTEQLHRTNCPPPLLLELEGRSYCTLVLQTSELRSPNIDEPISHLTNQPIAMTCEGLNSQSYVKLALERTSVRAGLTWRDGLEGLPWLLTQFWKVPRWLAGPAISVSCYMRGAIHPVAATINPFKYALRELQKALYGGFFLTSTNLCKTLLKCRILLSNAPSCKI